ncbi:3-demethylubiquinone-9 3-methyltransferase [Klebsiella pneumoniae]|uniref:3-demethylubiquinone-9 3-methyltransferase n=1 Tax=Klebsiella pneumoniae TaxID=573 RepID=A0A2X3ESK8_KLEPN|nr:3-demethylubiquinone-9 3-methyltransferase [Klebsiella pneumoniae]
MNAEKTSVAPNVDHAEIAKFEAVASRWWDLEGEFKPLHRINPLRLGYIAERSGGLFGKKVLDVGCGGGILAESMAREGATVTGLDMGGRTAAGRQAARPGERYSGKLCSGNS